jgi:hypothetical protein
MDLIANLTSQLGLEPDTAKGLAGAVLGQVEQGVGESLGGAEASAFRAQLPELGEWKSKIAGLAGGDEGGGGGLLGALGGGGLGGGLLGAAGSLLGGAGSGGLDVGALVALAGKAGLGGEAVQQLLPLVLNFLKSRLDPALLSKILGAVPGLEQFAGLAGGAEGGGLAGALGGLFGR